MRRMAFRMGGLIALALVCAAAHAETRSLADIKAGKRVSDANAAAEAEADAASTNAADKVKVPAGWMRGVGPSGYERALELQQASGLDMLVLFFRESPDDEKGLCHWFDKKGMSDAHVVKQMRKYIKVRIDAGANDSRTRALVAEYQCGKTPRLVVRQPSGRTQRVNVFNWDGGGPALVKPADLVTDLKSASSPSYQAEEE